MVTAAENGIQEDQLTSLRTLMLLGGNEWRSGSEVADSWWLSRAARARVTVVTSAAQDIPETQVSWADRYFGQLGASVEGCLIQTRRDAADPARLEQLKDASAIYLCGGDPGAAQDVLWDSPAAEALRAAYRAGVPLAGSSAGAMVLGEECLVPGQDFALRRALGLVAAVVIPHWTGASRGWVQVASRLGREREVIAIDESTGICWDGSAWTVRGPGRAAVIGPAGELEVGEGRPSPPVE